MPLRRQKGAPKLLDARRHERRRHAGDLEATGAAVDAVRVLLHVEAQALLIRPEELRLDRAQSFGELLGRVPGRRARDVGLRDLELDEDPLLRRERLRSLPEHDRRGLFQDLLADMIRIRVRRWRFFNIPLGEV